MTANPVLERPSRDGSGIDAVPVATRPAGAATTCAVVATRIVRKSLRTPKQLLAATAQTALFLLLLRYVFGGVIGPMRLGGGTATRVAYVDFLVPGYIVGGALFSVAAAAVGIAQDIEEGFSDRLRSLPVPRAALVGGHSLADTALIAWGLVVATLVGFLIGFRIHGSVADALLAFGLCVVFGFAFTWVFISLGLLAGNVQTAVYTSMLVVPLLAISSAFVPVETMPGWMQSFARHQPITPMTNAVRSLALGDPSLAGLDHPTSYWVLTSLLWCAALIAVFVPVAVTLYRRP